jgi:hypothetical protein
MAKVFISYSQDSDLHKRRVYDLAVKLRSHHVEVVIDQDILGGPDEGWDLWCETQVLNTDKVLIACTERYCARYEGREAPGVGLGSTAEARLIHRIIHNTAGITPKFRVILFQESDTPHVPITLQTYHRFPLYQPSALAELVAWLTASPSITAAQTRPILWPPPLAVPYTWDMADRQSITERLEQVLTGRSPKRILLLSAASNSGKTHLLAELRAYAKRLNIPHASLDCKGEPLLDELISLLALDLQKLLITERSASAADRRISLINNLQHLNQAVLITVDTYEQASAPVKNWIETQFLPRLDGASGVVAVLAGQQMPARAKQLWAGLAEEMNLESISDPSDWLEYARRKGHPNVDPQFMAGLTFATKGNPGQLSALLENMMTGLREAGASA